MIVFRTGKRRFIHALDGKGGLIVQGRWHSKGHAIIYTSSSMALSLLEVFKIHNLDILPDDICGAEIEIPDKSIELFDESLLQDGWNDPANYLPDLQSYGDRWLTEQRSLALRVPSAVVPCDYNYLINPNHPDIEKISMRKIFELQTEKGYLALRMIRQIK